MSRDNTPVECDNNCGEALPVSYLIEDSYGRLLCPSCAGSSDKIIESLGENE